MPQQLAQYLISRGLLPAHVVNDAVNRLSRDGGSFDTVLLEMGVLTPAQVLQAIADVSSLRPVDLANFEPNFEVASLLPLVTAQQLKVVPLSVDGGSLHLACAYPPRGLQIKELGVRLGRKIELWVALECRVHDWQHFIYAHPLLPRFERLLSQLDPTRAPPAVNIELVSPEVLERISQGIIEEPLLLEKPKKKKPSLQIVTDEDVAEHSTTSFLDPTAYARFASTELGHPSAENPVPVEENSSTRILDISGYQTFAKEVSAALSDAQKISFPGGVLPPRRSTDEAVPAAKPTAFIQPASEARPTGANEAPSLSKGISARATPLPQFESEVEPAVRPTPPVPAPASAGNDEIDFSDVKEAITRRTPVPAAPPRKSSPSSWGWAASPAAEWTLAQARAALKDAVSDREKLMQVVLDYGGRTFEFVSSFAVRRGAAVGWAARGDGDVSAIRQVEIPLDAASVFRTVTMTRGSYLGPLPPDALSLHYISLLGRSPRTVFLWPIEVQTRLVALIYGDCGPRPISQRRLSDFILFCQDLPTAFQELILFRKYNPHISPTPEAPPPTDIAPQATLDAEWFEGLIILLTGPDASERSMAMLELMKAPDAAAQALAKAFPGPTAWSRLPVFELPDPDELGPLPGALARLGQAGALAIAPLLESSDGDTRYLALLTAGSLSYPEVVDGVLRGLFDMEPDISSAARAAASALRHLPHFQSRLPDLRDQLSASDGLRRSLTARALGVLHDRESIESLINLTGSDDDLCAQSAADALKEITGAGFGTNPAAWSSWWEKAREKRRVEWLIHALRADEFTLRLAAIEELSHNVGERFGYLADASESERASAVTRWDEWLASRPDFEL